MAVYEFEGKRPTIGSSTYVHEYSSIIGDVKIGERCFIGAGAVIRGDYGKIEVDERTSVQENSVIHARANESCAVGKDVQVGHGAILHNCRVRNFAVIGLGSRVCDYAEVGVWSIIGEGAVVSAGTKIPDGKVAVGIPARVIRDITSDDRSVWAFYKEKYVELSSRYRSGLKRIS